MVSYSASPSFILSKPSLASGCCTNHRAMTLHRWLGCDEIHADSSQRDGTQSAPPRMTLSASCTNSLGALGTPSPSRAMATANRERNTSSSSLLRATMWESIDAIALACVDPPACVEPPFPSSRPGGLIENRASATPPRTHPRLPTPPQPRSNTRMRACLAPLHTQRLGRAVSRGRAAPTGQLRMPRCPVLPPRAPHLNNNPLI